MLFADFPLYKNISWGFVGIDYMDEWDIPSAWRDLLDFSWH